MNNTTPEGFRTAAYLAAKARLDARKTTRNVQCNPPNVRCGNRCIPPSWDCRLKGQGTDPHLRATQTDPLGGLANIQRAINGGLWSLQGSYGRTMMQAISDGWCLLGNQSFNDYYGNRIPSRTEVKEGTKGSPQFVLHPYKDPSKFVQQLGHQL